MLSSIVIDHIGAAAWRESRRLGMSPTKHSKPPWVAKLSVTGSHLERRFADGVRDEAGASADGRAVSGLRPGADAQPRVAAEVE